MLKLSADQQARVRQVNALVHEANGRAMLFDSSHDVPIAVFFMAPKKNDRSPANVATVQFFDTRFAMTPRGRFIASYTAATILQHAGSALIIDGASGWDVPHGAMRKVNQWLLSCVAVVQREAEVLLAATPADALTPAQLRAKAAVLLMQATALDGLMPDVAHLIPGVNAATSDDSQHAGNGALNDGAEDGDDYVATFEIGITADSFENAAKFAVADMLDESLTDSFGFDLIVRNSASGRILNLNVDHVNGEVSRIDGHDPTALGPIDSMDAPGHSGRGEGAQRPDRHVA